MLTYLIDLEGTPSENLDTSIKLLVINKQKRTLISHSI